MHSRFLVPILVISSVSIPSLRAAEISFDRIVIDDDFPGAYQVEVADVNGDKKPDVIAVGGGTCAWYENPSWKKRLISTPKETPGIISSATADLDGDGKAEVAIAYEFAMNEPKKGKLALAVQGKTLDDPWTVKPVGDVPSIHRLRWAPFWDSKQLNLIVAPIFGPKATPPAFDQEEASLRIYQTGTDPLSAVWTREKAPGGYVMHAIAVPDDPDDPERKIILTANNLGVFAVVKSITPQGSRTTAAFDVFPSPEGVAPKRGSSEVHLGRLAGGKLFLTTVEPWHGSKVVVRLRVEDKPGERINLNFGEATVIDDTLDEGHALWTADIDGDGTSEIFAGHRGKDYRVSMYRFDGNAWNRTILDKDVAAQDLRGGDLDGDGTPDVVTVGGSTHNVVLYHFLPQPKVLPGP
jgi:hypothetical protein